MEKFEPEKSLNGVIFMEDLGGLAKSYSFVRTLRIEQVKNLVETLSSFHAYQFTHGNTKWKGLLIDPKLINQCMKKNAKLFGAQKLIIKFKTAYKFALIYQCTAVIMLPAYFTALGQSDKNLNRKEIVEAEIATLELRGRLTLEDMLKIVMKHSSHWSLKL